MTQTPLLLQTLSGQPTPRPPIWLMRQAGRYLPEYQKIRAQARSFNTLYRTPKLATEVTLQPLKRFALDAAIIFSDILTVPEAYGHRVDYVHGLGPQIQHPLQTPHAIAQLTPRPLTMPLTIYLRPLLCVVSRCRKRSP